jgi:hypothetical protein
MHATFSSQSQPLVVIPSRTPRELKSLRNPASLRISSGRRRFRKLRKIGLPGFEPAIRALEKLDSKRGRLAIRGHTVRESYDFGRLGTTADMAKRVAEIHFNSDPEELTTEDTESE